MNLLGNAVRYTERGCVELTVNAIEVNTDDVLLSFSIRDTGVGIPADQLPRLFTPFSRVDASGTVQPGGTGLGLSICKRIVGMMGGGIEVTSEPGHGSTFSFTARFGRSTAQPTNEMSGPAETVDAPPLPETSGLAGKRALVVDDNEINQEIARQILAMANMQVDVAHNGLEAIERLQAAPLHTSYDVVLLDIQMPGLNGFATVRRLRNEPRFRDLPIIALTANALADEREKAIAAGMTEYLVKPIDPASLLQLLRTVISSRSAPTPAPAVDPDAPPEPAFRAALHGSNGAPRVSYANATPGVAAGKDLPSLPQLDIDQGLRRLGLKPETYRRVLEMFMTRLDADRQAIRVALEARNGPQARALLHDFKGMAGNALATQLYENAIALHDAIRDARWTDADRLMAKLDLAATQLALGLANWQANRRQ